MKIIYLDKNMQLQTLDGLNQSPKNTYLFKFSEDSIVVGILYQGKKITSQQLSPLEQYFVNGYPFHVTPLKKSNFYLPNRQLTILIPVDTNQ